MKLGPGHFPLSLIMNTLIPMEEIPRWFVLNLPDLLEEGFQRCLDRVEYPGCTPLIEIRLPYLSFDNEDYRLNKYINKYKIIVVNNINRLSKS